MKLILQNDHIVCDFASVLVFIHMKLNSFNHNFLSRFAL